MPLLINQMTPTVAEKLRQVKMMIFDVDGVLTDGGIFYGPEGEVMKRFNCLDGHGLKMLHQCGIKTAIITARASASLVKRAEDLHISHLFQGVQDKRTAFAELLQQTQLKPEQCGYLGDDIIDLPVIVRAGFTACVANAHIELQSRVHYVSQKFGGNGAAREICDLLLQAQGHYETLIAAYLA